jgi:hypothetical protein
MVQYSDHGSIPLATITEEEPHKAPTRLLRKRPNTRKIATSHRALQVISAPIETKATSGIRTCQKSARDHIRFSENVFISGFVRVTTLARANVKMLITALSYNLYQLRTIRRKALG